MSFVHKEQLSPSSLYQIGPLFSILVVHPSLGRGVGEGGGGLQLRALFPFVRLSQCVSEKKCLWKLILYYSPVFDFPSLNSSRRKGNIIPKQYEHPKTMIKETTPTTHTIQDQYVSGWRDFLSFSVLVSFTVSLTRKPETEASTFIRIVSVWKLCMK